MTANPIRAEILDSRRGYSW